MYFVGFVYMFVYMCAAAVIDIDSSSFKLTFDHAQELLWKVAIGDLTYNDFERPAQGWTTFNQFSSIFEMRHMVYTSDHVQESYLSM